MQSIVFATHNNHKAREIEQILNGRFHVQSLNDLGYTTEIPETGSTLEENALLKARFVHQMFASNCFADDTGLEVETLGGAPGVYSARYAGEHKNSADNIQLLLRNMQQAENRRARFRTVIALVFNGKEYLFDGIVNGSITSVAAGSGGFGYDPVFVPDGYTQTFAQLDAQEKNRISHRGLAIQKMCDFLAGL